MSGENGRSGSRLARASTARGVVFAVLAAAALSGCGSARTMRGGAGVGVLRVRAVDWNPQKVEVGRVDAVVESDHELVVLGAAGASVFSAGALVAVDHSTSTWRAATTIPAADGNGRWIVAIDGDGRVRRLRERSSFETVSERWGLAGERVDAVVDLGRGFVGFLGAPTASAPTFAAIADGKVVTRFDAAFLSLAGGGGRAAATFGDGVRVIDPGARSDRLFTLAGVRQVALDTHGRLFAATEHEVYEESTGGVLSLRYETADATIHGLTASGDRVWFADGGDLGVIDLEGVAVTRDLHLAADARLAPSTADVWAISGGALRRFARDEAPAAAPSAVGAQAWSAQIRPVFARACSACHLPGGSAGVDLSTFERWEAARDTLRRRVVQTRSMPPQGHPLSDADRAAIEAWVR